jgi:hypothetical protein
MDDSLDPAPPHDGDQDGESHALPKGPDRSKPFISSGPAPIVVVDAPPEVSLSRNKRARYLQLSIQMADELCPWAARLPYDTARYLFSYVGLPYQVMIPPTPDREREFAVACVAAALRRDPKLLGPELYERCIDTKQWYWGKPTLGSRSWREIHIDAHKLANVPMIVGGDRRSKRARRAAAEV